MPETNFLGLTRQDYVGAKSTLCPGCGHDAITSQIIQAAFELGLEGHQVAKLSGIGCSSKTPTYFLNQAWGFNTVHGRAATVLTGVALANSTLKNLLVSGDGDSMSIGLGHFIHMIRRNVPVVYILENNGVYGLTKGQFSATADPGSTLKRGLINELPALDPCRLAIELECPFVARSFSGNPKQLCALIKAAFSSPGCAIIDVLSPCVSFNNHDESPRSYKRAKERETPLHDTDFIPHARHTYEEVPPGEVRLIQFPDGSELQLRSLGQDYDPSNAMEALTRLRQSQQKGEYLTGLLYQGQRRPTLHEYVHGVDENLATLPEAQVKPCKAAFNTCMNQLLV